MKPEEKLLLALTDVGDDLIEEAGHLSFPRPRWLRAWAWTPLWWAFPCTSVCSPALELEQVYLAGAAWEA